MFTVFLLKLFHIKVILYIKVMYILKLYDVSLSIITKQVILLAVRQQIALIVDSTADSVDPEIVECSKLFSRDQHHIRCSFGWRGSNPNRIKLHKRNFV